MAAVPADPTPSSTPSADMEVPSSAPIKASSADYDARETLEASIRQDAAESKAMESRMKDRKANARDLEEERRQAAKKRSDDLRAKIEARMASIRKKSETPPNRDGEPSGYEMALNVDRAMDEIIRLGDLLEGNGRALNRILKQDPTDERGIISDALPRAEELFKSACLLVENVRKARANAVTLRRLLEPSES